MAKIKKYDFPNFKIEIENSVLFRIEIRDLINNLGKRIKDLERIQDININAGKLIKPKDDYFDSS